MRAIKLASGGLAIKKGLAIQGPVAGVLATSGNDASRVFDVSTNQAVSLSGLTISHGKADHGGGIPDGAGGSGGNRLGSGTFDDGSWVPGVSSLTVTGSAVPQNNAQGGEGGGGSDGQSVGGVSNLGTVLRKHHASASNGDIFTT